MATAAELKQRWYDLDGPRLTRAVRTWLMGQIPRPDGLSEIDGRIDLRGLPLSATPFTLGNKDDPDGGVTWQSLDLRRAELDGLRFFGAQLRDCLFDSASLLDLRFWGTEITDCSFRRAKMPSAKLGGGDWKGRRNVWRKVAFDRANMPEATFTGAILAECTFDTPSRRLVIADSQIEDCVFRGQTNGLLIDGRGLDYPTSPDALSADFSQAVLREFNITGYKLDRVTLPDQKDLIVVQDYPAAYRRAATWLSGQTDQAAQRALGIVEYDLKAPGAKDSDACFDLHGFDNPDLELALGRAFQHAKGGA